MINEKQKELLKATLKNVIPVTHTQIGKAIDFIDKFVDLGNSFNELDPFIQNAIIDTFLKISITTYPFQFNPNYKKRG